MVTDEVLEVFGLGKKKTEIKELKAGNINDTFLVTAYNGDVNQYIFQKINTYVFKEPEKVMFNIAEISRHIENKLGSEEKELYRKMLCFLHATNGNNYYVDKNGGFWRAYKYIDRAFTYDYPDTNDILYSIGYEFGQFQMMLSDFDASVLYDTIPDFHNTKKRMNDLFSAVGQDVCGRAGSVKKEIGFFSEIRKKASELSELAEKGVLPIRVTHNDTKCNNVLFDDETKKPVAVIDLDTVMPGLSVHDFGDAVRSAASTVSEDERDLTKVSLDLGRYEAFTKGFISQAAGHLSRSEIDNMVLGALTITWELASRFLADYINGDIYFKTRYEGHNLDRARCQIALAKDMEKKFDQMNDIVYRYAV